MTNPNQLLPPSLPSILISQLDGKPSSSFADATLTEAEITACEQLIQLSESTGDVTDICSQAGSGLSSTRSINAPMVLQPAEDDDVAENDEGLWRRKKRYRLISDVYASTSQIASAARKRKGI